MIAVDTLDNIADAAALLGEVNEAALATLRRTWPELRFTLCSDEDMPARMPPMLQRENFNLYLVGGGEHCISLTIDFDQAIGVVVATVDADD